MAPNPKPIRRRTKHYLKEWRKHRHLTQEQVAARLEWDQSKLSRLENGKVPYDQDILEALSEAYNCNPAQLIEVNPLKDGTVIDLLSLFRSADEIQRKAVINLLNTLKSGTNN